MATRKRTTQGLDSAPLNDWAAAIASHMASRADVVPPGWKSVAQIADELGRSISHTSKCIRGMIASGGAEVRTFTVQVGDACRRVPHYRVKGG